VNTPQECFACHESDYNSVSDPNHVANSFSHDCTQCHSTTAWEPSSFNHASTNFPLTGAHTSATCIQCHSSGYSGTTTECSGCHQQNYDQTSNPNHLAAHFPVQCTQCHTTTAWLPANWNHDSQHFPINSGAHRDKWTNCGDCHTNLNDYGIFSCITCHEHNQTDMNDKHDEVPTYAYDSNLCFSCHPTGGSED
jgi:nitrate/TMAO reductase-like tetraheme cytochrome c subunit